MNTFLNFSKARDFQEFFKCKCKYYYKFPDKFQAHYIILGILMMGKKRLTLSVELAMSHVTLINITQLARMVYYLNLMNF